MPKNTFWPKKHKDKMPDFEQQMNRLGRERIPFLFVLDYALQKPEVVPLSEVRQDRVLFDVNGLTNAVEKPEGLHGLELKIFPVEKPVYCRAFEKVQNGIHHGDSFLLNLTMPHKISLNRSLKEVFYLAKAKYKLWFKDKFTVFSPEPFVKIKDGLIRSFPMKGTMDASLPDAEQRLLSSKKELAEHYTIVDLIRNDLSMVAGEVTVERFRFIEKVQTHYGELLQMSSEIKGILPGDYTAHLGTLFKKILPAGSISGAPKGRTLEIIRDAEQYDRGYYTGVFGIFDGANVDSGVMIRYIEKQDDGYLYKSGGGITANSNCEEEYDELIKKIYVPLA